MRQKKIAVIPTGILDDGMVCCDIELEDFEVAVDEYVDVPYNVKSEDLNVKGDAEGIIRVHGINGVSYCIALILCVSICMRLVLPIKLHSIRLGCTY